jgi:hypothetical protein
MSAAVYDTPKRQRGRPRFTCDQCNQHKKKCTVLEGMSSCVRCERIGHGNCSFALTPAHQHEPLHESPNTQPSLQEIPTPNTLLTHQHEGETALRYLAWRADSRGSLLFLVPSPD